MKSTEQGRMAEKAVADRLKSEGYKILAENWRRPSCEIDIVAKKGIVVYFTEVKYRGNRAQGSGFEYVTPAKQKQMEFAGRNWCAQNDYDGDWRLMAASVSGPEYNIELVEL